MASLFGLSTCFQFNDPDWYFWIPLYASACFVNLLKFSKPNSSRIRKLAKFGLCLGVFLFIKVGAEDLIHGISGIWNMVCPFWLALPMASASFSLRFNIIKCNIDQEQNQQYAPSTKMLVLLI
ncbi:hypothetical protein AAHA92_05734 [Salvia divinorum]|uniref:Transmembrane protein n=1 Tax=Salvia divinorum TaxID=28513 RepID=A0ABD1I4A9_SALDI